MLELVELPLLALAEEPPMRPRSVARSESLVDDEAVEDWRGTSAAATGEGNGAAFARVDTKPRRAVVRMEVCMLVVVAAMAGKSGRDSGI